MTATSDCYTGYCNASRGSISAVHHSIYIMFLYCSQLKDHSVVCVFSYIIFSLELHSPAHCRVLYVCCLREKTRVRPRFNKKEDVKVTVCAKFLKKNSKEIIKRYFFTNTVITNGDDGNSFSRRRNHCGYMALKTT